MSAESVASPAPLPLDNGPTDKKKAFISDAAALLRTLKRLRDANDNVAYRTSGGLRIMIRNDPESETDVSGKELSFDVSVIIEDEPDEIVKAIKNEIDIMEDDSGCIVIEDYSFQDTDTESLQTAVDFLNAVDLWTVCPCGEFLIKDAHVGTALKAAVSMCYYCECTRESNDTLEVQCPICHDHGSTRWMVKLPCCGQSMHRKCQQSCIASSSLRLVENKCPLCCRSW